MSKPTTPTRKKQKLTIVQRAAAFYGKLSLWNKLALLALVLALPAGYGALLLLKPVYKNWRAHNALQMAASAIESGDQNAASLAFRTAIRSRPKDPQVWRKVAQFLDELKSPESFSVWSRVVKMEPDDLPARFALVDSALAGGRVEQASEALAGVPESARTGADYLRAAAAIAIASNQPTEAERHLVALESLEPESDRVSWDLARVRSVSTDESSRAAGLAAVEAIATGENPFVADAQRHLVRLALSRQDFYTANRWAEKLVARPDATAEDQILFLDTEFASQSFTLPGTISETFEHARDRPEDAPLIIAYLTARGLADRVATWFEQLPPDVRSDQSMQLASFDFALQTGDWSLVFEILRGEHAPHTLSPEFVDATETGLADHRRGDPEAIAAWQEAIRSSGGDPASTYLLASMAKAASWPQANRAALWRLTELVGQNPKIWLEVLKLELQAKDSVGILRALSGAVRADPDDRQVRNDWILLNLLLDQGNPDDLLKLAADNASFAPDNFFYTSTHAMALSTVGRHAEAVAAIELIDPADQNRPERALYVGTVLVAAGEFERAQRYLDLAESARGSFLPEEEAMLSRGQAVASGAASVSDEVARLTTRREMTESEAAEFAATLQAQRRAGEGLDSEEIAQSLREAADRGQRSPEEIEQILQGIRGESAPGASTPESASSEASANGGETSR